MLSVDIAFGQCPLLHRVTDAGLGPQTVLVALAFLVMVHRNPHQVRRLLRAIYRPGDAYVIHIDRGAPAAVHRELRDSLAGLSNLEFLPSLPIRWGGWRMVEVELRAIRRLLERDDDWSHYINLSGQDFPLQPVAAMETKLAERPSRSYLEFFRPHDMPWTWENPAFRIGSREFSRPASRVDRVYVEWPLRRRPIRPVPLVNRAFPSGFTWYGGSQWKVLSRDACRYLTERSKVERLWRFYRYTFIPDESFFQTALLNSRLRATIVNDSRRLIRWDPDIVTFTEHHLDLLVRSDAWFARKFDERVDDGILDLLEVHVGDRRPPDEGPPHGVIRR